MSRSKDQFGVESSQLAIKLQTLVKHASKPDTMTKLGIQADDNTKLTSVVNPFLTAQAAMANKNAVTRVMTDARDAAQKKAVSVARKFVLKWYYHNDKAEDTDILDAGLEPYSDVRTKKVGSDIEMPVFSAETLSGHRFEITVKNAVGSKGKPTNIVFFRTRYFLVPAGESVPENPADFHKFKDSSSHPIVLVLPPEAAGQPIALSACYVDAQGNEGPYSPVVRLNVS